ncbi:MAG: PEGA domain-containing protein [Deltaproteobacteria bacterium]|nr:PEGA domain-containing protein [Deltaproteobacteria bacterium]
MLVESEPAGAPLAIYERIVATAEPFAAGGKNTGWQEITSGAKTPHALSLRVGFYHVAIEAFEDYKRSETDVNLAPGHVYTFKANLSQGEFLGFLRVTATAEGAKIYVDDPPPHKRAPWGRTPHGALINPGKHRIWVEASGHEPFAASLDTAHGKTAELEAKLRRVPWGMLEIEGDAEEVEIDVDGQEHAPYLQSGKPANVKLPAGKHQLVLDASGRKAFAGEIDVPRGQTRSVHATLNESYPRGQAIASGVLAVAAGVGGYFLYDFANRRAEKEDEEKTPEEDRNSHIFRNISYGVLAGAGVLAGVSIFFSIYDPVPDSFVQADEPRELDEPAPKDKPKKKPEKSARGGLLQVGAQAGPQGAGLGVGGRF